MMQKQLFHLAIAFILVIGYSCEKPDPPLSRSDRNWIDSLYSGEIIQIKEKVDSICIVQHDSIYQRNYDSILQKRRNERELIIQNLKINNHE